MVCWKEQNIALVSVLKQGQGTWHGDKPPRWQTPGAADKSPSGWVGWNGGAEGGGVGGGGGVESRYRPSPYGGRQTPSRCGLIRTSACIRAVGLRGAESAVVPQGLPAGGMTAVIVFTPALSLAPFYVVFQPPAHQLLVHIQNEMSHPSASSRIRAGMCFACGIPPTRCPHPQTFQSHLQVLLLSCLQCPTWVSSFCFLRFLSTSGEVVNLRCSTFCLFS